MRYDSNHNLLTRVALIALFGLTLLGQADSALAAAFNVSPTRILLSSQQTSALLTLTNDSDKAIRFQLSVVAWDQSDEGQMKLTPNSDIIIFPPLVTIAAHESRRIRVGAQVPAEWWSGTTGCSLKNCRTKPIRRPARGPSRSAPRWASPCSCRD